MTPQIAFPVTLSAPHNLFGNAEGPKTTLHNAAPNTKTGLSVLQNSVSTKTAIFALQNSVPNTEPSKLLQNAVPNTVTLRLLPANRPGAVPLFVLGSVDCPLLVPADVLVHMALLDPSKLSVSYSDVLAVAVPRPRWMCDLPPDAEQMVLRYALGELDWSASPASPAPPGVPQSAWVRIVAAQHAAAMLVEAAAIPLERRLRMGARWLKELANPTPGWPTLRGMGYACDLPIFNSEGGLVLHPPVTPSKGKPRVRWPWRFMNTGDSVFLSTQMYRDRSVTAVNLLMFCRRMGVVMQRQRVSEAHYMITNLGHVANRQGTVITVLSAHNDAEPALLETEAKWADFASENAP